LAVSRQEKMLSVIAIAEERVLPCGVAERRSWLRFGDINSVQLDDGQYTAMV
jgi:predicted protein tyrosine phosphatase